MSAALTPSPLKVRISRERRALIEARIETLIALLDFVDGDFDVEEDDPSGGDVFDVGEIDETRPEGIKLLLPVYGPDQSRGPVNEREMYADWQRRMRIAH